MSPYKFGEILADGTDSEFRYPHAYAIEETSGPARFYHVENDVIQSRLLAQWNWIYSPLRDGDDY